MTAISRTFDLQREPLEAANLIEASAGTGKTYTISALFLRLLLEQGITVDKILVVTFTEAATCELKNRIRKNIRAALGAFETGLSDDPFIRFLINTIKRKRRAKSRLTGALRDFDQAAVFTIHGFCRRMLMENAFESGGLFDTELVADLTDLKKRMVADYWRKNLYSASFRFAGWVLAKSLTPDELLKKIQVNVLSPDLRVIPNLKPLPEKDAEARFIKERDTTTRLWPDARDAVTEILETSEALNRNAYNKTAVAKCIRQMDTMAATPPELPGFESHFHLFIREHIEQKTKKNQTPPEHPFFDQCTALVDAARALEQVYQHNLTRFCVEAFHYAGKSLSKEKQRLNIKGFDDLISGLHKSLTQAGKDHLSRRIRGRFPVALIDEFQDTDPLQYEIFRQVFHTRDKGPVLYLIGDPKQAIYGFRGADIHTYMAARNTDLHRFTLGKNWRSSPAMIQAVNSLFSASPNAFVYADIPFSRVVPGGRKDLQELRINGMDASGMVLWLLPQEQGKDPSGAILKSKAETLARQAVCREIQRLLDLSRQNRALLGNRPLMPGDMAVLVLKNKQAVEIQADLTARSIPSVIHQTGDVYDTAEAVELERILVAMANPGAEKRVKAALCTDIMGVSGTELWEILQNEAGWEDVISRFRAYHDTWAARGFYPMFQEFLAREKALERLARFRDGERRATNLLHLGELLHQVEKETGRKTGRLAGWLVQRRLSGESDSEASLMRLESDAKAVRIVTIHKSKGMEYPMVFCPYLFSTLGNTKTKPPVLFHDDDLTPCLDFGSREIEAHGAKAREERLAEEMRLLYVALTRAVNRCYGVWGNVNQCEQSAFYHLTAGSGFGTEISPPNRYPGYWQAIPGIAALIHAAGASNNAICLEEPPGPSRQPGVGKKQDRQNLTLRTFPGGLPRAWSIHSFSAMTSQMHDSPVSGQPDADTTDAPVEDPVLDAAAARDPSQGIHGFPKGARAGSFFHELFEHLDFVDPDFAPLAPVLADYGFEEKWLPVVQQTLSQCLATPLHPDMPDLTLSAISNENRVNEMGFYYPVKPFSPTDLAGFFSQKDMGNLLAGQLGRLTFSPSAGFMKGYMDLVFCHKGRYFLVDYKTNHLGYEDHDYGPPGLEKIMARAFYVLQYHLYLLALDQYLALKIPDYAYDRHFGGVFYLFIRGISPGHGPGKGVYFNRPAARWIHGLRNLIMDDPARGKGA